MNMNKSVIRIKKMIRNELKSKKFVFVGIAGGSGSGKTWLAKKLGGQKLPMDDYYIGVKQMKDRNFDKPSALDLDLLSRHLKALKKGKSIRKPVYSFIKHDRKGYETYSLKGRVLIVEGLFALTGRIKNSLDIKIFLDMSEKTRLKRRIKRDMEERGRPKKSVLIQWKTVERMYRKYVLPTKKNADLIIKE
jgi:uridine kinase